MEEAHISPRQLALRVGVTPKTVERWLANAELIPHARNRVDVSKMLGVSEAMLWPKVQSVIKTGADREVVAVYPTRAACPTSVWAKLIADAQRELLFAGFTNYFLWLQQPDFASTLRAKAEQGCRVRFLLGDPDSDTVRQRERIEDVPLTVSTRIRTSLDALADLGDVAAIEARFSDPADAVNHISLSVFRFDGDVLVTPHLARNVGHDSPMMHFRRHQDAGAYDRFTAHAEELWERGTPVPGMGGTGH
jgi:hypothetical protein